MSIYYHKFQKEKSYFNRFTPYVVSYIIDYSGNKYKDHNTFIRLAKQLNFITKDSEIVSEGILIDSFSNLCNSRLPP